MSEFTVYWIQKFLVILIKPFQKKNVLSALKKNQSGPRVYKTFSMINSVEHEIPTAHKTKIF